MTVVRGFSLTLQAAGLIESVHSRASRDLFGCVTDPTESPGDEQRGVRRSARLEAGELEESQRTFLNPEEWRAACSRDSGIYYFEQTLKQRS